MLAVQTPTVPHTAPLAVITPGVNAAPVQAPNREAYDSSRNGTVLPLSLWVSVVGVNATPPVSETRTAVYQPAGVEKLQPVLLNGTGFSPKVAVSAAVLGAGGGVGVGVGDDEPLLQANSMSSIAEATGRVRLVTVWGAASQTGC